MNLRLGHIGFVMLLAMALLCSCNKIQKKKTDWTITHKREKKNPYDTHIAYQSLDYYFPDATKENLWSNYNFEKIGENDYYSNEGQSMLVLVGGSINFSKSEWESIKTFMYKGNQVVLLASNIDEKIQEHFRFTQQKGNEYKPLTKTNPGSKNLNVLGLNAFPEKRFGYWGRDLKSYFVIKKDSSNAIFDSLLTLETEYNQPYIFGNVYLENDTNGQPNFIQYQVGEGRLTLLATPLVLSNFFLLQEPNRLYSDHIWQSVPKNIYKIYWGNFYAKSPNESLWGILWRNKATRWAIIITLFTSLVYLLFQIKRRQRVIPIIPKNINSSAAFIETVGMLYYNKGDNTNLALKMKQHFMDWVRTKFNINTNVLNETFEQQLSIKSGMPIQAVQHLLALIHQLKLEEHNVSNEFLFEFYNGIQQFYKTN